MTRSALIPELLAAHETATSTPSIWLDVSRGLVSPEEAAEAVQGHESPALIERSKALFAPPTAAQERAIRAQVLEYAAPAPRTRGWGWLAPSLALAAALALALTLRNPEGPASRSLGAKYDVTMSSGQESLRGGPDEATATTYRSDQRVDFTLRPSVATTETGLDVLILAYDDHGESRPLAPTRPWITSRGVLRISERLDDMGLSAGTWRLTFVLARPGQLPTDIDEIDEIDYTVARTDEFIVVEGPRAR